MLQFSFVEALLFNIIRSIPLIMLAFYPFLDKRRFSARATSFLFELIVLVWLANSLFGIYFAGSISFKVLGELAGFAVIAALYALAISEHPGKMLFFCFLLINIGYLITVASKCLEGFLFPEAALLRYHWTVTLCLCIVAPLVLIPVFLFLKWEKENLEQDQQPTYIWKYSWLVPTTFYLIWVHEFYGTESAIQWCTNPFNLAFISVVTLASFLIYYIILRMVIDNNKLLHAREQNHALQMQVVQYGEISQRIAAARQIRHDTRHRLLGLENLANAGDLEGVRRYIQELGHIYELDESITFCSNSTVNAVLTYYAREAKKEGIGFQVELDVPEDVPIARNDLSILVGNLLENAVEACRRQLNGEKKIRVRGQTRQNTFTIAVDNTFEALPEKDRRGRFRSMKHSGAGIGTESVKSIVAKYHGVVEFEPRGDLFCVSLMLYLK